MLEKATIGVQQTEKDYYLELPITNDLKSAKEIK